MKTKVVRPEVLNKFLTAAVMAVMRNLYQVNKGVRVTFVQAEGEDLSPSGVKYNIRMEVQISGEVEPVVLEETPAA